MDNINIIVPKKATDSIIKANSEIIKLDASYSKLLKQIETGQATLKSQGTSFQKVNEHQKNTKKITKELTTLEKEKLKVQKQLKTTTAQIAIVNDKNTRSLVKGKLALQEDRKATKLSINAKRQLAGTMGGLEAKSARLVNIIKKVNLNTKIGQGRFKKLTAEMGRNQSRLNQMNASMKRFQGNVGNYKSGLAGIGSSLKGLVAGYLGVTVAIMGLVRIVKSAIKTNIEFEKTFTNVLGLLNEIDKKKYGEILKKGSAELIQKYGFEVANVNKSLFDTISNGIAAGDAIEFLNKSSKLAIAGNAELSSVVKGATKVYEIYKNEVGSVDEILNAFFVGQVKGATDVELIANNIGKVASIAHFAKIPVNELFGTFAGLTKFLDGTEESATALTATITALLKVKEGTDQAKVFEDLKIEFGAAAIQSNGLLNTLLKVAKAAETDADKLSILIPSIRALKGIAGLTAESIAEIEKNILALNDTEQSSITVQKAFNEQMETQDALGKSFRGSLKALSIEAGGSQEGLKGITKIGISLVDFFTKATKRTKALDTAEKEANKTRLKSLKSWFSKIPLLGKLVKIEEEYIEIEEKIIKTEKELEAERAAIAKTAADKAKAASDKKIAEAKIEQEKIYQIKKGFGVLTDIEIYNHELEALKNNNKFAILSEINKQKVILDLKKKYNQIAESIYVKEFDVLEHLRKRNKTSVEEFIMDEEESFNDEGEYLANKWKETYDGQLTLLEANLKAGHILQVEYDDKLAELKKENTQRELEDEKSLNQAKWDLAFQTNEAIFDIISSRLDAQMQKNESARENELERAGEDAELKDKINTKYDKKQAELKTKQAKADKAAALFAASINIAMSITKSLAQFPLPLGLPMLLMTSAMGALQLAMIAARPIPKYKQGTKGKYDTEDTFVTSEPGAGTEWIENAGKIIMTTEPTIHRNSKGSRVYKDGEFEKILNNKQVGFDSREIVNALSDNSRVITRAIKNQKQLIIENGKVTGYRQSNYTRKYIERMTE